MARPARIRYTKAACIVEDKQADRIQALGSTSSLTTEDLYELSNLNKTEVVDDVPAVDITIDSNEYGSNCTLALLADKGYGCQVVAYPTGSGIGSNKVEIYRGAFPYAGEVIPFTGGIATISGTGTYSIGLNPLPDATGNNRFSVTSGTSVATGHVKIAQCSAGAGPIVTQANITDSRTFSEINILDFEFTKVAIAGTIKQSSNSEVIHRTQYMENCYVNRVDLSYQTRGNATENVSLETDNKRWFLNSASNIVTDYFKTTGTSLTLTQTPATLVNGNKILKAYKNGEVLTEGATNDFSVSNKVVTLVESATTNDIYKFRYCAASGGAWPNALTPSGTTHGTYPGAIKQGQVELFLSDDESNRLTRCQSVRISCPLRREALVELGALQPYDRPMEIPIELTVSIEFTDSDLTEFARLCGKKVDTATEISIGDLLKDLDLIIKVYRENDVARAKLPAGHPDTYPIRTIKINNLIPTSERWEVRVGGDGTQTFDFRTDNITFSDKLL